MARLLRTVFFWLGSKFRPGSNARIFSFWDGTKYRTIDPVKVLAALSSHPVYVPDRHYLAAVKDCDMKAMEIVASAVSDVFEVQAYNDGKGLTVAERLSLLSTFYLYCEAVKKNTSLSPT
ncbi:MAG: hypothetical protein U0930_04810 [Pirellulales bacterium]